MCLIIICLVSQGSFHKVFLSNGVTKSILELETKFLGRLIRVSLSTSKRTAVNKSPLNYRIVCSWQLPSIPTLYFKAKHSLCNNIKYLYSTPMQSLLVQCKLEDSTELEDLCKAWNQLHDIWFLSWTTVISFAGYLRYFTNGGWLEVLACSIRC